MGFFAFFRYGKTAVSIHSIKAMKHSPLTLAQLKAIQDRNIVNTDAMTLLREIKRLHGILNNAWQVFDTLPPEPPHSPLALLTLLVNNEPSVKESRAKYDRVTRVERKQE